jgi:hypothetical protein
MDGFVRTISGNPYLNAVAIFITLGGAVVFLWSNRKVVGRFLLFLWRVSLGRFVTSIDETHRQTTMSIRYERYLIAVMARHFAVVIFFLWFFMLGRDALRVLESAKAADTGLHLALVIFVNVLSFVVGSRLYDVIYISRRIIEAHDSVENEHERKNRSND